MYKKTFKYIDYNGTPREEDVFFNLNESEIAELSFSVDGGLDRMIKRIVAAQDIKQIIAIFKDLLLKAYGEKSPDGRQFIKSPELSKAFSQTEMYNQLFMELSTDAEKAAEFINAITPDSKGDGGKIMNFRGGPLPGETPQDTIRRLQGADVFSDDQPKTT